MSPNCPPSRPLSVVTEGGDGSAPANASCRFASWESAVPSLPVSAIA